MKKLILNWLFGTDVKKYEELLKDHMKLLHKSVEREQKCLDQIQFHLQTLNEEKENLDIIRKLIKICENHGINADEEIKHITLYKSESKGVE